MHLTKILFPVRCVALGLFLVAPLFGQPASASPKEVKAAEAKTKADVSAADPRGESRELANARFDLEALSLHLGDNHPDIVSQRLKIAHLERLEPRKFSLDFSGGPVASFIAAVARIEGISFNVIASDQEDLRAAVIPPFSLRNITLVTLLEVSSRLIPREFVLEPAGGVEPNSVVCILRRRSVGPGTAYMSDFESFQLTPYLADQSIDDIIGAIRAAWELNPAHTADGLRLKYHPATSILLVSGQTDGHRSPSEAIDITRKVLSQVKRASAKDPKSTPVTAPAVPPEREKK
ncbi:MAG TPA: hypothetical protein VHO24_17550 [Opitutaceae bacterium]|nr:hypothetical protein [Opitutaceae bacterium]